MYVFQNSSREILLSNVKEEFLQERQFFYSLYSGIELNPQLHEVQVEDF